MSSNMSSNQSLDDDEIRSTRAGLAEIGKLMLFLLSSILLRLLRQFRRRDWLYSMMGYVALMFVRKLFPVFPVYRSLYLFFVFTIVSASVVKLRAFIFRFWLRFGPGRGQSQHRLCWITCGQFIEMAIVVKFSAHSELWISGFVRRRCLMSKQQNRFGKYRPDDMDSLFPIIAWVFVVFPLITSVTALLRNGCNYLLDRFGDFESLHAKAEQNAMSSNRSLDDDEIRSTWGGLAEIGKLMLCSLPSILLREFCSSHKLYGIMRSVAFFFIFESCAVIVLDRPLYLFLFYIIIAPRTVNLRDSDLVFRWKRGNYTLSTILYGLLGLTIQTVKDMQLDVPSELSISDFGRRRSLMSKQQNGFGKYRPDMDSLFHKIAWAFVGFALTTFLTVLLWTESNDSPYCFGDLGSLEAEVEPFVPKDLFPSDSLSTPGAALVLTRPQSDYVAIDLSETVTSSSTEQGHSVPPEEEEKLVHEMMAEYYIEEFSSCDLALIPNQAMGTPSSQTETDKNIAAPPSSSSQTYWPRMHQQIMTIRESTTRHYLNQWQQSSSHTGGVESDHQMPESSLPTYEELFHKEGQRFRAEVFDSSNRSNMDTYKGRVEATGSSALVSQQTEAWEIAPVGRLTKQLRRSEDLNSFAPHVPSSKNANSATSHWSPTDVVGSSHQNTPGSEQQGEKTMSPSCKTLSAGGQAEKPGSSKDLRNLHSSTLEVVMPEGVLKSGRAIPSCSDLAPEQDMPTPITSLIKGGQYLKQEIGQKHSVAQKTVEGVLKFVPRLGLPETTNALTVPSSSASGACPQPPMVTVDVMPASTNVGSQGIAKVSAGKNFTAPALSENLTSNTFYQNILELVGMDCSAASIKLNGDKRRGGSDTTFRRRCRENGILRWPNCRDTNECHLFKQIVKDALQITENSQGSNLTEPQSTGDQFLKNILSVQAKLIGESSIKPFFGDDSVNVSKARKTNLPDSRCDDKESEESRASSRLVFRHTQPRETIVGEMQTKLGFLEDSSPSAMEAVTEQRISESSRAVHTCSDLAVKQDMATSTVTSPVSGRLDPQQKVGLKRLVAEKTIDGVPKRICKGNEKQCSFLKEKLVTDLCSKDSRNSCSSSSTVASLALQCALIVPSSMSGASPHPALVTMDVLPASTRVGTQGLATGNVSIVSYVELERRADEHEVSVVPGVDEVLKGVPRQYHDILQEVWLKHSLTFRNVKSLTPIIRVGTLGVLGELLFQIRGTNFMDVTLTVLKEFHESLEFLKQNSYDIEWIQNHLNHIADQRGIFEANQAALGELQATRERLLEELRDCDRLIEERETQLGQAMNGIVDVDIAGTIDQGLL